MRDLPVAARWWSAVAVLCLAGLAVSTYLAISSLAGDGPACGLVPGCREVAASDYSKILGVPVAIIGVAGYSLMLLGSLAAAGLDRPPAVLRGALLGAGAFAAAFSVYLTVVEVTVIHAVCVYCLSSACIAWVSMPAMAAAEYSGRRAAK